MEATLAERGQVVIPKAVRDQLGLTPGTLLTFSVEGGKLIVRKKIDDAFSRARGILKLEPGETVEGIMRDLRGRAPGDPIEPWEELRDDINIPATIREDHARRRAIWLAAQKVDPAKQKVAATSKIAAKRASQVKSSSAAAKTRTVANVITTSKSSRKRA